MPTPSGASNNIHCRLPARGLILTIRHRQERLQWRQHWRYGEEFSSRMKVVLYLDGAWQSTGLARRGGRYADACVMEGDSWGGQIIMVWGAIGINHKSGPVIF